MIPSVHYFLGGYRVLEVEERYAAALLELCRLHGFIYEDFRHILMGEPPARGISLRFPRSVARRVECLCEERGIPVSAVREGGLPRAVGMLFRRPGLVVGGILGILLLAAAQSVVWDIRVSGNSAVSDKAVRETLAECGFSVGSSLRGFEADKTENEALLRDGRLAWISINRKGTVAYVEVREKSPRPPAEDPSPCDVVAARGGVIERIELEEGNVRVAAGQAVGEGDVLVSGLYDSMTQGIRITAARARVYARTTRILTVEIPLSYTQKIYATKVSDDGDGISFEKSVNFFENHIKFSKKTGNLGGFYDTIEEEASWGPIRGVGFPISTRTVWYVPYETVTAVRTPAEAEELARLELAGRIAALSGAELLGQTIAVACGEDTLTLTCTLTCIEDIGTSRPIFVGD